MQYSKLLNVAKEATRLIMTPSVDDEFPFVLADFRTAVNQAKQHRDPRGYRQPKLVCLCGSTRFKDAFVEANRTETLSGNIVLSVGLFGHVEGLDMNSETKAKLDELHLQKIAMADEILVLNVNGYVGESTLQEMMFAEERNIAIRYLVEPEQTNTA